MKRTPANPTGNSLSSLGQNLAIVFEFLGMLGFAGLVGYALQRWVWPEYAAVVLLVAMMSGLAVGIYHIMQRVRSASAVHIVHSDANRPRSSSVDDAARSLEELRELRRKLDNIRGPAGRPEDRP